MVQIHLGPPWWTLTTSEEKDTHSTRGMPRVQEGEEGRGTPRNASGSRVAGCDPRMTEWGNPSADRPRRRDVRSRPGTTRELKHLSTAIGKANANSSVAASEREECPNGTPLSGLEALVFRVAGDVGGGLQVPPASRPRRCLKRLECRAPAGESPVGQRPGRRAASARVPPGS